jgi:hypothetical protein
MAEIINIGDMLIQRKLGTRSSQEAECDHKQVELDDKGDIVRCMKCTIQLSAFWVLEMLASEYARASAKLEREKDALVAAKAQGLHLLAARKVEAVWRSRSAVPCCPHCGNGILPEDGLGSLRINRAIEMRRRSVVKEK